jgi:branched-chain amino acid aminotransferase
LLPLNLGIPYSRHYPLQYYKLARDKGVTVSERKISVEEVFSEGSECFVAGTAAGVTPIESLTTMAKR